MTREKNDMKAMSEQMQAFAERAATGAIDPDKASEMAEQMMKSFSTEGQSSVPVTVVVQLIGDWMGPIEYWNYAEDSEKGTTQDERYIADGPIAFPMVAEITATYSRGDDGRGTIAGNNSKTEPGPHGGTWDCPDIQYTTTTSINMSSHRKEDR